MYTEQEAQKNWCPMGRMLSDLGGSTNEPLARQKALCIASDCMMWRFVQIDDPQAGNELMFPPKINSDKGYCGLAGKPA